MKYLSTLTQTIATFLILTKITGLLSLSWAWILLVFLLHIGALGSTYIDTKKGN